MLGKYTNVVKVSELCIGGGREAGRVGLSVGQAERERAGHVRGAVDRRRGAQVRCRAPIDVRPKLHIDKVLVCPVVVQVRRPHHPAHIIVF